MTTTSEMHFIRFAIQWSSIVLLYYDYALTFPSEVKWFWGDSKIWRTSTLLYVLCRCDVWYKIIGASSVLGRGAVVFTILMRTYAVCAKNMLVLISLSTMCIAILVYTYAGSDARDRRLSRFVTNTLLSVLVCAFEASATLLTLVRTLQTLHSASGAFETIKNTVTYLVAEQGILYFAFVSLFTVSSTVLNFRASGAFLQRLLNAFTLPVSGMLTARFILRLRAWPDRAAHGLQDGQEFELSAFVAHTRSNASIADEFGADPVASLMPQSQLPT
ncbi:hypothetical protein K488DRAFT_83649 [Vararia minispora EC-137]|uniref:Uncharacterized protein n=1 Tax=Vararia minispora EC-137 TaxID=1314806 RepID=A0ACB8QTA9_9AGAM|nr:hypothetical protein K488DRAFT_83649 [Vararia minispora EC-137]